MQTALVEVLLNGEVLNTVVKPVTPAEIMVLKSIHGHDCISNPVDNGSIERTASDETERLRKVYGVKAFGKVFPGALPRLPVSMSEAGVDLATETPAPKKAKTKSE